jgi:hypothetical protein
MLAFGGLALTRIRLSPNRKSQARRWALYFHPIPSLILNLVRSVPQFLWGLVPRRTLPPHET